MNCFAPSAFVDVQSDSHWVAATAHPSWHCVSLPQRITQLAALSVHLEAQSPKFVQFVLFAHWSYWDAHIPFVAHPIQPVPKSPHVAWASQLEPTLPPLPPLVALVAAEPLPVEVAASPLAWLAVGPSKTPPFPTDDPPPALLPTTDVPPVPDDRSPPLPPNFGDPIELSAEAEHATTKQPRPTFAN